MLSVGVIIDEGESKGVAAVAAGSALQEWNIKSATIPQQTANTPTNTTASNHTLPVSSFVLPAKARLQPSPFFRRWTISWTGNDKANAAHKP
jgi:hypothetical protein